ncbi:MAG: GNAT family N-acetyltransferase [Acidimicrobiia bacterium]
MRPEDTDALCEIVDADRLPGQPRCSTAAVESTLAGACALSSWWWSQLRATRTVAVTSGDELLGAGAVGQRTDGFRYILWLHGREEPAVVSSLLVDLLRGVRRSHPTFAFCFATDLAVGLEGLPRQRRPATYAALLGRGFTATDRWLYLHARGPGPAATGTFRTLGHHGEMRVEMSVDGDTVGEAEMSVPHPGSGVLWWLEVDGRHRRRGYGRQLLRAARQALAGEGATETILFVDHDRPSERDRRPALSLYRSEGFEVIDHLWSFARGEGAGWC